MVERDSNAVTLRIVFWGVSGCGKTTNLRVIHSKLRADHRGELKSIPTRLDPTVTYETLPIRLGQVAGVETQLQIVAVPGGREHAHTRKQLLDEVDGIIFVVDCQAACFEANLDSFGELRDALAAYGRRLDEFPVVIQYNKFDLADPTTIENLHRRLHLPDAAAFETVATEGKGVLQSLTTISKRVVRMKRSQPSEARPAPAPPAEPTPRPSAAPAPRPGQLLEDAILAEGEEIAASGRSRAKPSGAHIGGDLRIVSAGAAEITGQRQVRVPLVLGNAQGETVTVALSLSLDPLLDEEI